MPQFADWPYWLQLLVVVPHGILAAVAAWLWWPKTPETWRKFGIVAAYLLVFLLVMRYVFKA